MLSKSGCSAAGQATNYDDLPHGFNSLGGFQLLSLFAEDGFAAELDFVAFQAENLDQNLVAFFQFVADFLDSVFGDLADVQQAVGAGEDFDKRTEIHQSNHFAKIRFADFRGGGEIGNDLQRLIGRH